MKDDLAARVAAHYGYEQLPVMTFGDPLMRDLPEPQERISVFALLAFALWLFLGVGQ